MRIGPFSFFEKKQTDEDILALLGASSGTSSGVAVSADTALQVPAVQAAVRTIAEAAASLDRAVVRIAPDGTETKAPEHPAHQLITGMANDWTDSFELVRGLVVDALTRDQGGLAWVNWTNGQPAEIIRYRPGIIAAEFDKDGTGEPHYRINGRTNFMSLGGDALTSMVDKSASAEEAIKKLIIQLAFAAAQAALLGSGPLAGLFGGMFGGGGMNLGAGPWGAKLPGFATGTANTGGSRGEPRGLVHGQEAVIPLPSGGKVPVQMMGGAGSQAIKLDVDVGVSVDNDGNLQAYVKNVSRQESGAAVSQGLQRYEKGRQKRYQAGGQFG